MKIEQYRPEYFSGYMNGVAEVNSFKELTSVSWIWSWKKLKNFHRFSIAVDETFPTFPQHALMAEFKNGSEWWVIAITREKDIKLLTDNLPRWRGPN